MIEIKKALQSNPDDAIAHGGLAAVYADTGKLPEAEQEFKDVIRTQLSRSTLSELIPYRDLNADPNANLA